MAAGDTTITSFKADDSGTLNTQLVTLGIAATDIVITWNHSNETFVARIELV